MVDKFCCVIAQAILLNQKRKFTDELLQERWGKVSGSSLEVPRNNLYSV